MIVVIVESFNEVFDGLFNVECELLPIERDIANSIDRIFKYSFILMVLRNAFVNAAYNLVFLKLFKCFRIVFGEVAYQMKCFFY